MNVYKGRMPTKIELTLEQLQQGVSNDVLVSIEGVKEIKKCIDKGSKESSPPHKLGKNWVNTYVVRITMLIADIEDDIMDPVISYALSWKPCQGDSLNLPDHRIHKDGDGDALFQLKSDSLPHAHAQTTKTYYKHRDSRIMKAQELKTKTSAQTLIYKIFLQRYQVYQGRLLASFQDDAKPNGDALRKCILEGPYTPTIVTTLAIPAIENSPAIPAQTTVETVLNMSPENKAHFESEKEVIHLILTRIGDEIYSTVDACQTTHEMWEAIERLQQGESLNIQDVK
ncbi:hypothetical protein Tco_1300177, partial [Tanacetum coccineum]